MKDSQFSERNNDLRIVVTPEGASPSPRAGTTSGAIPHAAPSESLRTALEMCSDAIFFLGAAGLPIDEVNQRACTTLGYSRDELLSMNLYDITPEALHKQIHAATDWVQRNAAPETRLYTIFCHKNGCESPAEVCFCRPGDRPDGVLVAVARAVDNSRRLDVEPFSAMACDPLTGLPSRPLFHRRLALARQRSHRYGCRYGVCFVDLDNFKVINDQHGHLAGDQVLQAVARRLLACANSSDMVTRFGGDEFLLVLDNVRGRSDIVDTATRIRQLMKLPIQLDQQKVIISASIGIATSSSATDETIEELLHRSDKAMYRAKDKGRGGQYVIDEADAVMS